MDIVTCIHKSYIYGPISMNNINTYAINSSLLILLERAVEKRLSKMCTAFCSVFHSPFSAIFINEVRRTSITVSLKVMSCLKRSKYLSWMRNLFNLLVN